MTSPTFRVAEIDQDGVYGSCVVEHFHSAAGASAYISLFYAREGDNGNWRSFVVETLGERFGRPAWVFYRDEKLFEDDIDCPF
jgi:hypothetical protein